MAADMRRTSVAALESSSFVARRAVSAFVFVRVAMMNTQKPLRRTATQHAQLSYLFGTVIVAMMINVVAGLVR